MKKLFIAIGILLSCAAGLGAAIVIASETGAEVVVVKTAQSGGSTHSTRLWVVDDDEYTWLRAGMGRVGWVEEAEATGELIMTRDGADTRYRVAVFDDPESRDRIHAMMAEKYGMQNSFIYMFHDGSGSIAVRLEAID